MRRTALNAIHELARADERVVFVGSDLGAGTLEPMRQEMPGRFFMEGISEQHIIGMAAGLAMEGYIPYVNTIATFLTRRCFEQVAVDICMHNLPVRLIGNGGGMVYAPLGPTHTATEDLALMRALPGMTVLAPCDAVEMGRLMPQTLTMEGPLYIRLAKGGDRVISGDDEDITIGRATVMREPGEVLLVSTGVMTQRALKVVDQLEARGIGTGLVRCHTVKPLDREQIRRAAENSRLVVTLEEHTVVAGFGSSVTEVLTEEGRAAPPILRIGLPDGYIDRYGSQDDCMNVAGLEPDSMVRRILSILGDGESR